MFWGWGFWGLGFSGTQALVMFGASFLELSVFGVLL